MMKEIKLFMRETANNPIPLCTDAIDARFESPAADDEAAGIDLNN